MPFSEIHLHDFTTSFVSNNVNKCLVFLFQNGKALKNGVFIKINVK